MAIVDAQAHALWEEKLREHLEGYYGRTLGMHPDRVAPAIERRLALKRGREMARTLDEEVGLDGKQVLDVGSGWGELVVSCTERGAHVHGVEPDGSEVDIARLLLRSLGYEDTIVQGYGEAIPWPDNTFDLVTCQQVLEHVDDIGKTVQELVRVTRPGGTICVSVPNYLFPWEGHYGIKWFPLTPKPLGGLILRAMGRDPEFLLHHVNYTTYPKMKRLWRRNGLKARHLSHERAAAGTHPHALYHSRIGPLLIKLRLFPNMTWLLEKP